jgi:hypothetical protein
MSKDWVSLVDIQTAIDRADYETLVGFFNEVVAWPVNYMKIDTIMRHDDAVDWRKRLVDDYSEFESRAREWLKRQAAHDQECQTLMGGWPEKKMEA